MKLTHGFSEKIELEHFIRHRQKPALNFAV